jgi:hypothetical protein
VDVITLDGVKVAFVAGSDCDKGIPFLLMKVVQLVKKIAESKVSITIEYFTIQPLSR